jgi:hypothetical protein
LLYSVYRIVVLTLQDHALRARHSWHEPHSIAIGFVLGSLWLCALALLVPAGSIGASELWVQGRSGRAQAAAFVALLCASACGQYWVNFKAEHSEGFALFAHDAWMHDGRSWLAAMCLLEIIVFAATATLLKSPGYDAPPALSNIL